jgi:hypothetical protein
LSGDDPLGGDGAVGDRSGDVDEGGVVVASVTTKLGERVVHVELRVLG